jgi:DNA-binding GntR family transcriptional regulator
MKLSQKIAIDMSRRLLENDLAFPLTLHGVANFYQVSLTPAREAMLLLEESGYLRRLESGRLRPATKLPAKPIGGDTSNSPEERLRNDIILRSLAISEPEFIREVETAKCYDIGRSMLRRIFANLASEGLLEIVPRRGWSLRPFRNEDLAAYLDIRKVLEVRALELAWPRLDLDRATQIRDDNRPDSSGHPQMNDDLHDLWISSCGNDYIIRFFETVGAYFHVILNHAAATTPQIANMAHEHVDILSAIIKQDLAATKKSLAHHIDAQMEVLEALRRQASTKSQRIG